MASKNLGAVIQRAISDGAFRRQLQSDPAAALRGFNLTPTEIAAIRSGDASKLMSLGVDQRVSKAFSVSGEFLGATRSAISDMGTGATSNGIVGDPYSGARDALTSGNLSGTRAVNNSEPVDTRGTVIDSTVGGTRSVNDSEPVDTRGAVTIGDTSGTRAIHDTGPTDLRAAASTGDLSGTRAVQDTPPFGSMGTSAVEDPNAPEFRAATSTGDLSGTRAVQDTPPYDSGVNAAAGTGTGDPYSGQYVGVSPDFQARLGQATTGDAGGPGDNQIAADDNYSVSSRMADAGAGDVTRSVNDVAPLDTGIANAAAPTSEFIGGDIQHDPGMDATHNFVPSDSADVQREMLDGIHDGGALGNTGGGGNTSS